MEYGEEQAYYQAMGDAAEAEAQAAMNAEAESKLQDEVKDDPVASYRAELKKKIEGMKYDTNIPLSPTQLGHNGVLNYVLSIIDQTTEI